ncbi:hypothetical protein NR800_04725 [Corallococcus interemptor]|uniref:hypothetical protein n=1 Tax=Corallococcus interemptor TaxID=2316720 RepID=UPI0035D51D56
MSKWSACLSLLLSACLSSEGESALAPVDQQQALPASEVIDFSSASTLTNTDASGKSGGMTVLKTNSSNPVAALPVLHLQLGQHRQLAGAR